MGLGFYSTCLNHLGKGAIPAMHWSTTCWRSVVSTTLGKVLSPRYLEGASLDSASLRLNHLGKGAIPAMTDFENDKSEHPRLNHLGKGAIPAIGRLRDPVGGSPASQPPWERCYPRDMKNTLSWIGADDLSQPPWERCYPRDGLSPRTCSLWPKVSTTLGKVLSPRCFSKCYYEASTRKGLNHLGKGAIPAMGSSRSPRWG